MTCFAQIKESTLESSIEGILVDHWIRWWAAFLGADHCYCYYHFFHCCNIVIIIFILVIIDIITYVIIINDNIILKESS